MPRIDPNREMERETSKRTKLEDEEDENGGTERLNSLTDELVMHIFGFLDTKHAVQVSFSLKKWMHLWTLLPNLHFDYSVFKNLSSFDNFVEKVLSLRDDSVKLNKFNFRRKIMAESMFKVVSYAVSHDVQHLTLSFRIPNFVNHLGFSNSLGNLQLDQLGTLSLEKVTLTAPENFSGFPHLQNLTLNSIMVDPLSIVAPRLLRLTISDCFFSLTNELVLSTPRLTFFKITDYIIPLLQSDDLMHLDKVDITMDHFYSLRDDERELLISKLISMLNCCYNASSITLCSMLVEFLSMHSHILAREPSRFCNLKCLNIVHIGSPNTCSATIPCNVTTYFLRNSPDAKIAFDQL